MSDVKPNSILRRMGLGNDDILKAVDGHPLTGTDQLVDFFENMKSSDSARLEIYRRGRPRFIEYRIHDKEVSQ
jgi:general secretion pathway protein C